MDPINTQCEEYFDQHHIPYKKNIDVNEGDDKTMVDYVIPGAVVRIMSPHHIDKKWCIRISRMIENIPKNFVLYIYFYKSIPEKLLEELVDYDRVKIILDYHDIKPFIQDYYIINTSFIKSMGSLHNTDYEKDLERFKHVTLYTSQHTYDTSTIIMNPEELKRVKKFNIQIKENPSDKMISFNNELSLNKKLRQYIQMDPIYKKYNYFVIKWNICMLETVIPHKHIDGITNICPQCKCLYFLDLFKGDICIKCDKSSKQETLIENNLAVPVKS